MIGIGAHIIGTIENMNWTDIWTAQVWACEVKNCKLLRKNSFFAYGPNCDLNTEKDSAWSQDPCCKFNFNFYPKVVSGGYSH